MSLRVLRCPPRGPLRLRPGKAGSAVERAPTVAHFVWLPAPRGGHCACGPAKPVPRPLLVMNFPSVFASLLLVWLPACAQAESVALAGMMGGRALLVVDGTSPKTVAAGETHQGVKVISTLGDEAVIEQSGKRRTLRVGEAPVSMGGNGGLGGRGNRIVLTESGGGHFMTPGQINGRAVQFMIDTGATSIAMSMLDADRAGISYKNGQAVQMSTANGTTQGFRIKLASVRVADVEVYDVDAVVTPQPMPFMLLGNSFLTRFQMKRDSNLMTLDKRY